MTTETSMEEFMDDVLEHAKSANEMDLTASKLVSKDRTDPILIVDVKYGLEVEFLKSKLVNKNEYKGNGEVIEICVPVNEGYKPLGHIPLTFESILEIKSYGNFDIKIKDDEEVSLTDTVILMLP